MISPFERSLLYRKARNHWWLVRCGLLICEIGINFSCFQNERNSGYSNEQVMLIDAALPIPISIAICSATDADLVKSNGIHLNY